MGYQTTPQIEAPSNNAASGRMLLRLSMTGKVFGWNENSFVANRVVQIMLQFVL